EVDRVVEPGGENLRRPAVELRSTEHDDCVGRPRVVAPGGHPHLNEDDGEVGEDDREDRQGDAQRDLQRTSHSRARAPCKRRRLDSRPSIDIAAKIGRPALRPSIAVYTTCITLPGLSPSCLIASRGSISSVHSHCSTYAMTASRTAGA